VRHALCLGAGVLRAPLPPRRNLARLSFGDSADAVRVALVYCCGSSLQPSCRNMHMWTVLVHRCS
jgi:hypothetical protein